MTSWTVWEDYWKQLPYSIFYNILQFIESIDIRRDFKLPPRKLIINSHYTNLFNNHLNSKLTTFIAKFNNSTKTLHVLSYYLVDNEDFYDMIFSHKIYKNIQFDHIEHDRTYFKNLYNTHTETDHKYLYFSNTSIFVQKGIKTNVVISYGPVQNVLT